MSLSTFPKRVAIVGFGMVGKATACLFDSVVAMDRNFSQKDIALTLENVGFVFLCLPTQTIKGKQDLSAITEWLKIIKKVSPGLPIIIRSTILPGTTDMLLEKYGLRIAHVPEFLTESTAVEDSFNPEFLVVGARDILLRELIIDLFLNTKMNTKKIIKCSPTTAELIKYTMNSFFALKVIFGNQIWDVAKKTGADYSKVREALESHKWGSVNGFDVWHSCKRGFAGKCLPKDTEAFSKKFDLPLIDTMIDINNKLLKENE